MTDLLNLNRLRVDIDEIENHLTKEKNLSLSILRLDKINKDISGNKIFKLHYFLEKVIRSTKKIITFGGAFSNHLLATASACNALKINSLGIVRGEKPANLSHTLLHCKQLGIQLKFISREEYKQKDDADFKTNLEKEYGEHVLIPEGGFSEEGMRGASLISSLFDSKAYSHVCCAVGTATTLAGLIHSSSVSQHIVGFSALKNLDDFEERIQFLLKKSVYKNYSLINDYDFGGFAKRTEELTLFMNEFYREFSIPTDFVYTGKMMFGIFDLMKKNYFSAGSKILCIHTGGLQGNLSLPNGVLNF